MTTKTAAAKSTVAAKAAAAPAPANWMRALLLLAATEQGYKHSQTATNVDVYSKAGKAPPDYCRQIVFELVGVSLAFQQQAKLFRAPNARVRAEEAVSRILDDAGEAL